MLLVTDNIDIKTLNDMSTKMFGNLVKAVVDIERGVMVVDAELHADQETFLLENGSEQKNLWGINIYPNLPKDQRIEFDSMINLRPTQGNMSRGVDDSQIRAKILKITDKLIK